MREGQPTGHRRDLAARDRCSVLQQAHDRAQRQTGAVEGGVHAALERVHADGASRTREDGGGRECECQCDGSPTTAATAAAGETAAAGNAAAATRQAATAAADKSADERGGSALSGRCTRQSQCGKQYCRANESSDRDRAGGLSE